MRALVLVALLACAACTWQSTGKPWTAGDYAAQVGTFGMYGAFKGEEDNAAAARNRTAASAAAEVDRCVAQGGDPVGCRQAVYGSGGFR